MVNVKRSLVAALALVIILGLSLQSGMAANLAADDFNDGTLDAQWINAAGNGGIVVESGGVLTCTADGTDAAKDYARITMASTHVVPAGDFCLQMDINVTTATAVGDRVFANCSEGLNTGDAYSYCSLTYQSGVGGGTWRATGAIYKLGGTVYSNGFNLTGKGMNWTLKMERVGNVFTQSARVAGGTWEQIYTRSDMFLSTDVLGRLFMQVDEGSTAGGIVAEFDNFTVPEPASASILLLGAVALLKRRKK